MFVSDDSAAVGGLGRAPSGLEYLSCGVAFCFMTQLGRYAQLVRQDVQGYRILQQTAFRRSPDCMATAAPAQTLVCIDTSASVEATRKLVAMGGQTCYLHASFSHQIPVRLKKEMNSIA